ncbi:MAG TPA: hypothetical protein VKD47_02630, partial [Miltoncostaeaceae bacterium]|nr:hypothetical protein [Miltoncostaeaceae bacterium]
GLGGREELAVHLAELAHGREEVAALANIRWSDAPPSPGQIVGLPMGQMTVAVAGVDGRAARARIEKQVAEAEAELERARRQLANPRFVDRAPAHLVDAEREKERRYAAELEELRGELQALGPTG